MHLELRTRLGEVEQPQELCCGRAGSLQGQWQRPDMSEVSASQKTH